MEERNITQMHSITPEELKESIIASVRAELQTLSAQFQPARFLVFICEFFRQQMFTISQFPQFCNSFTPDIAS